MKSYKASILLTSYIVSLVYTQKNLKEDRKPKFSAFNKKRKFIINLKVFNKLLHFKDINLLIYFNF